jgi:hypothetical protein
MLIETNNLVTIDEYARMIKLSNSAVRKQIKEDRLICVQVSKHKYIDITNCKPIDKTKPFNK